MPSDNNTILPSYAPLTWLYFAGLVYLSCVFISIFLITNQPYLGISVISSEDGKAVIVSGVHAKNLQKQLTVGDTIVSIASEGGGSIALNSLSILEEPDNFKTYHEYNQFVEHQKALFEVLTNNKISLTLSDERNIQLKPADTRPIANLPFQFWVLLVTAGIGFYIGLWIWVYRRGQIEARLLAISGFGFMLGACCLAVYSNRELVIDPSQYLLLADLNHLGNITFSYSSLILLCYYPSKIANKPFVLIGYLALFLVWLNQAQQWLEIPIHTFYFLPYLASSALGLIVGRWQWVKHKNNPVAKASIRWFLLTLAWCIGCALILYFIPTIFNESPLIPVWVAQLIILSLYIGFVLGVVKYRLFDVEQWWFNCWVWFVSGACMVVIDLFLMYLLKISPLESLSVAILITAWCYFPIRQWLLAKKNYPRRSHVNDFFPLLTQSYIESTSIAHFENSWPDILRDIYLPLSIQKFPQPIAAIELSEYGLILKIPDLNKQQHIVISGKEKGGQLFNNYDVEFIKIGLEYARSCSTWKNIRDEGARQERERIIRDLHDDVGALLLTLIHKSESEESSVLARRALTGVRDTIYSLHDDNSVMFFELVCSWREEIKQRTDAAHVELLWNTDKIEGDTFVLNSRQRINLDRILRESITNILKHAHPQTISFCIKEHNNKFQIIITDDGTSTDSSEWQANIGLHSLHNRVKEIEAEILWEALDKGTKLTITLPELEKKLYAHRSNC